MLIRGDNVGFMLNNFKTEKKTNAEDLAKLYFLSKGYEVYKSSDYLHLTDYYKEFGFKKEPILRGMPDLIIQKGKDKIFVEVKTNGDGIRIEQINFVRLYPKMKYLFFFINQTKAEYKRNWAGQVSDKLADLDFLDIPLIGTDK